MREKKVTKRWFLSNFVLWFKNIGLWAKQFGRGCQRCIWRVQRNLLSIFIEKTMIFEWNLYFEQKISGLSQNFTLGFPKLQSMCPEKIGERDKIWKSDDFLVILYSKFKKLDFGQKSLARVVKAAIGVSRGIFWAFFIEKTMIFEWNLFFEQKKFRTLPKLYGRVSETSIYVSGEKVWEKKNEKKMIS